MFTLIIVCVGLLSMNTDVVQSKCLETPVNLEDITVHKVLSTWEEAHIQCRNEGAVLASPINIKLLAAMQSVVSTDDTEYFIGTKANQFPGQFTSEGGVSLDNMTATVLTMVQQLDPRDGNCLSMNQYAIRVVSCNVRLPFICYKTEYTALLNVNNLVCGTNNTEYQYYESTGSCYKLHKDQKSWDDASATCAAEGGYLVVIDDTNEANTIKGMNLIDDPYTYVGLRDVTGRNEWKSVTDKNLEDIYNSWYIGLPTEGNYPCAIITPGGTLDNHVCHIVRDFICEKQPPTKIPY